MSSGSPNQTLPPSLSTGSRITLTGLQNAAHLNNRQGILVRAPSEASTRHEVYLLRSKTEDWRSAPVFVRAQPHNILPSEITVSTSTPCTHRSPAIPHPLTTLKRTAIHDTIPQQIPPTTYFFGTVPPTYLLRGVPLSKKYANILLLACGDIRSVLYTVSRRTAAHGSLPKLRVILNDIEPCIMARNLVLLWLILRTPVDALTIFEIWFSLRISAPAYAAVIEAVAALTGPHRAQQLRAIGVRFSSEKDRGTVYRLFENWIPWRDKLDPDSLFARRSEDLNKLLRINNSSSPYAVADTITFSHHIVGDEEFPKNAAHHEIQEYFSTGCVFGKHPQDYVNPTMFKSPDKYSLHFESLPFRAFPVFAPNYDKNTPLRAACMNQLKDWVTATRKHGRNIKYVINTTDCLAFAMGLSESFDIVAMSNITDVVGLLPVLQATRGLVASSGYMFTQTVKMVRGIGYVEGYLRMHLGLPLELVPAILGWRCIGWEGKNTPDHCVVNAATESDGRPSQMLLTWEPTRATNVLFDAAACPYVRSLYRSIRDRMWTSLTSHSHDLHDAMLPLRVVHPLALIPVFASACNFARVIRPEARVKDVEFGDVLGFVTAGTPSDLAVASVALERIPLRAWGLSPSDPQDIFTVRFDSGVPYSAIEMYLDEKTDCWILSWTMSRGRAKGVRKAHLMYSGSVVVSVDIETVQFSDLSRERWNPWLQRVSSPRMDSVKTRRIEREDSCDIIFNIPAAWMETESNDNRHVRNVRYGDQSVELVQVVDGEAQKCMFRLPYPITRGLGNLQVDAFKNEAKFELRKAKYRLASLFLPDSHNRSCWFEMTTIPSSYLTWLVPQQLSPNELLRDELGKREWTSLCACKGIASTMFLAATEGKNKPIYLQSEDKEIGRTQSLMLIRGAMRREECTGDLAVDVKWMHKPQVFAPGATRNSANWPSHPPLTNGEFEAVLHMLEVRSEGDLEAEGVRKSFELLMKSNAQEKKSPEALRGGSSADFGDERNSRYYDQMHLVAGGRVGHAMVSPLMWPGQPAFLEREGSAMLTNVTMGWEKRVASWLKRGRDYSSRGETEFALLAFEQGAAQGLSIGRMGERVTGFNALVECLLEAVEIRISRRERENYGLISVCCKKALDLITNSRRQVNLKKRAEKIQSQVADVIATDTGPFDFG